ncbi:FbpB family small basic protein [Evansella tamaricis]|uniref:FbpB family small basic protein n=1 Tax=Evansella tamaricis TaxID=2069301 RepID=A0ABS6JFT0_9BACI|nr:FbpB family small basic protein [Evansella tamaricis]MBU9712383.1 FbpB family small basic protein [Evansella tamaricis]
MKNKKKMRFEDLIQENKQALLKDPKEMERIEQKLDQRHVDQLPS